MNFLPLPVLAGVFNSWEFVLILAVVLLIAGARHLPLWAARLAQKQTKNAEPSTTRSGRDEFVLWLAQGLDVGRIPKAPGTFGSLVGLLWFAVLLIPGSLALYLLGLLLGVGLSVWCCGQAERILKQKDPGSVVLDEIVAIPVCFLAWVWIEFKRLGAMPALESFFAGSTWWKTLSVFLLFRLFDITKPWPIRQSQTLPGGWGVTVDDLLAGGYVVLASLLLLPR
jgi:phosphatidylglycerophosphatase A